MQVDRTSLEALHRCFGLPPEIVTIEFELITRSAIHGYDLPPHGVPGRIAMAGDGFDIRFSDQCVLHLERIDDNRVVRKGRLFLRSCDTADSFIILTRLRLASKTQPYFMIPAVLYGTNNAGRGAPNKYRDTLGIGDTEGYGGDPQLAYRANRVEKEKRLSSSWHFRADRSAVPLVFASYDGHSVAIGVREASDYPQNQWVYNGLGVWTDSGRGDAITISMGSLDWPARIIRHQLQDAPEVEAIPPRQAGVTTEFFIHYQPASNRFAYETAVKGWYAHLRERPRPGPPAQDALRTVAEPLLTDGINPDTGLFCMFRDDHGIAPISTLLAWVGVLQISCPLMRAGQVLGNPRYVELPGDMVDRSLRASFNPNSRLFYDVHLGHWQTNNWWPDLGHTSLVSGHACHLLLKMREEATAQAGWMRYVEAALQSVLQHQRKDGRLPSGFSPVDGRPLSYFGFGGCFFVAPLLMLARLQGDHAVRDAATRALEHYWQEFIKLEWVGVDLDCRGAVDCGSSYALIRALVELHRQTRRDEDLSRLAHALHYACSYRFGHNTRHVRGPCDWSSCGAEVTSTHNVHIHAYGTEILEDLQYHAAHTGDPYFASRIEDSLAWSRQAYNRETEEYGWGQVGWVTEQFYHTYDRYHHPEGDGAVWRAYFPWAAGSLVRAFTFELERDRT